MPHDAGRPGRGRTGWLGAAIALLVVLPAPALWAQGPRWDLGDTTQAGQWSIFNRTVRAAGLGYPLAAGDLTGDGRDDLVLTPMDADSGPDRERLSAGEVAIVVSSGVIGGVLDLALLEPPDLPDDITLVYGADAHDYLGTQVAVADIDGDGYADAIVGAQYGDGPNNSRPESGEMVIIWGRPDIGGRVIDLCAADKPAQPGCDAPPAGAVTFVHAANPGDRLGSWVATGDVDADGIADAILGADQASPGGRVHAGVTYVLYGGPQLRTAAIDLAAPAVAVTAISGIDEHDHSGATVRGADLNGDGAAEVLIGAGLNRLSSSVQHDGSFDSGLGNHGNGGGDGPNNVCGPNCNRGEAYIVYGVPGERLADIALATPPPSTTVIYGIDANDAYGEELFAGDFNGDGAVDVAVGAITADGPGNQRPTAGELALIPGGPQLVGAVIHLASPPPGTTIFHGARIGAIAGDTIAFADLDNDGRDDLVIAAPNDSPFSRFEAGTTYVFFGIAAPLPEAIDLADIPAELPHLLIDGVNAGDMLAYSMSQGDVNGDGLTDLVLNVMGGDGFANLLTDAGDAYVLDAAALSRFAGREPQPTATVTATPTMTITAAPTATATPPPPSATAALTATFPPARCTGDCNGDGSVEIAELITAVRIALGTLPLSACVAADANGDGRVEIAELIDAVNRALAPC